MARVTTKLHRKEAEMEHRMQRAMRRHGIRPCRVQLTRAVSCDMCGQFFATKIDARIHKIAYHGMVVCKGIRGCGCEKCDKIFRTVAERDAHKRMGCAPPAECKAFAGASASLRKKKRVNKRGFLTWWIVE